MRVFDQTQPSGYYVPEDTGITVLNNLGNSFTYKLLVLIAFVGIIAVLVTLIPTKVNSTDIKVKSKQTIITMKNVLPSTSENEYYTKPDYKE